MIHIELVSQFAADNFAVQHPHLVTDYGMLLSVVK